MGKKCWFDSLDIHNLDLDKYLRKYVVGNIYEIRRRDGEDIIEIGYNIRNEDNDYTEYLTPYGLTNSINLVDGYNHPITHPAAKELFEIMHKATKNIIIDGKTYAEAFKEERTTEIKNRYNSKIGEINKEIAKLEVSKTKECEKFLKHYMEVENFVSPVIEADKEEKSLIVEDILKGMSQEEQAELLAKLGYAQIEEKKKETPKDEKIVINNGLNDIVLD